MSRDLQKRPAAWHVLVRAPHPRTAVKKQSAAAVGAAEPPRGDFSMVFNIIMCVCVCVISIKRGSETQLLSRAHTHTQHHCYCGSETNLSNRKTTGFVSCTHTNGENKEEKKIYEITPKKKKNVIMYILRRFRKPARPRRFFTYPPLPTLSSSDLRATFWQTRLRGAGVYTKNTNALRRRIYLAIILISRSRKRNNSLRNNSERFDETKIPKKNARKNYDRFPPDIWKCLVRRLAGGIIPRISPFSVSRLKIKQTFRFKSIFAENWPSLNIRLFSSAISLKYTL